MRSVMPLLSLMLAGCSEGASDACRSISHDELTKVFQSEITKAELNGVRQAQDEVQSMCDFDFENGDFLTLTLSEKKAARSADVDASFGQPNSALTSRFPYPVIHSPGAKELEALVSPTKDVNLRVGRLPAGMPDRVDEKLLDTLALVRF